MKPVYLISTIFIVLALFVMISKVINYRNKELSFQGVVQKVEYSGNKGTPTITINGVEYFLSGPIDFKKSIETGDSISKQKGEEIYKLTKKNTREVIVFKD